MEKEITLLLMVRISENDIIDSIKMLVSLSKILSILQEGDSTDENA